MKDRYSELYSYPENIYAEGCALLIRKAELLREKRTGKIGVSFAFTNLSPKTVKELEIVIGVTGSDKPICRCYGELWAARDMEFGDDVFLPLDVKQAESFAFSIMEISYTDSSVLRFSDPLEFSPIGKAPDIEEYFNDEELSVQYRLQFGSDCLYYPTAEKDLWHCTCGAVNHKDEDRCHSCNKAYATLTGLGTDKLRELCRARLEKERREKIRFEQSYEKVLMDSKTRKTRWMWYAIAAALLITFVLLLVVLDDSHYTVAMNAAMTGLLGI